MLLNHTKIHSVEFTVYANQTDMHYSELKWNTLGRIFILTVSVEE